MAAIEEEEPRKLYKSEHDFSESQLETIPLKKRLEILFTANIIPSRRQLSLKYGLSEQIIHNVLSHRSHLLQNWKYNADNQLLFSKLELEKAMAMTELLLEWKRRVDLTGLQMTDAALSRKALNLKKMLDSNFMHLSKDWWNLFNENYDYKQFRDSGNDSLEIEDILNDLEWMFTERAFQRLKGYIRRSKLGNSAAVGIRAKKDRGNFNDNTDSGKSSIKIDNNSNDNDLDNHDDLLDESDIKIEPNYYNDDDFDCEDYEFVLDEEFIFESLRKELEDVEAAKYKKYILGNNVELISAQEDEVEISSEVGGEEEEERSEVGEVAEEDGVEVGIQSDDIQEVLTSNNVEGIKKTAEHETAESPSKIDPPKQEIKTKVVTNTEICDQKPVKLRRKPRNMHAVLSLRKDYVRLPGSAELAQFTKKKFPSNESDEKNDSEDEVEVATNKIVSKKRTRKKANETIKRSNIETSQRKNPKNPPKKSLLNLKSESAAPKESLLVKFETNAQVLDEPLTKDDVTNSFRSIQDIKFEKLSPKNSDEEEYTIQSIENETKKPKYSLKVIEHNRHKTRHSSKLNEVDANMNFNSNSNVRRSKRFTKKTTYEESDIESSPSSNEIDEHEVNKLENDEIMYSDIEEKMTTTPVQKTKTLNYSLKLTSSLEVLTPESKKVQFVSQSNINKSERSKIEKIDKAGKNDKIEKIAKIGKNLKNAASKRIKRRSDGSDLTLRKDKVRIILAQVTNQHETEGSSETPTNAKLGFEKNSSGNEG